VLRVFYLVVSLNTPRNEL